jgi:hypothetical protein
LNARFNILANESRRGSGTDILPVQFLLEDFLKAVQPLSTIRPAPANRAPAGSFVLVLEKAFRAIQPYSTLRDHISPSRIPARTSYDAIPSVRFVLVLVLEDAFRAIQGYSTLFNDKIPRCGGMGIG